jgi:outer membrane lipoprotein-sorting protein
MIVIKGQRNSMPDAVRRTGMGFCRRTFLLAIACSIPLCGQSLNTVLARLDKTAQQFKSVAADLKRDVHTAIVNDDTIETGTIKVKRDKETRMLIDFTGPDAKTIAFDGSAVSIYYPKIKTVQIYSVGDKRGLIDQFLLLGFGATSAELQNAYEVSWTGAENIDGKATSHIELIPKSKDVLQRLKKAELWIADSNGMPAQQRFVTSASGDFMLVTYSNVKTNPSTPDGSLKLNLPKGVKTERPQL